MDDPEIGQGAQEEKMRSDTSRAVASFKVYVVLTTENEAGSNAVAVSRPV